MKPLSALAMIVVAMALVATEPLLSSSASPDENSTAFVAIPPPEVDKASQAIHEEVQVQYTADYLINDDSPDSAQFSDPWEPFNRKIDSFNYALDQMLWKPIAHTYITIIPDYGRQRVSHAIRNITTPVTVANYLLQGELYEALHHSWRFFFNSIFGLAGMYDVATSMGLEEHHTDGDVTFYHYCMDDGIYIVLPLLGPSTVRHSLGRMTDFFVSPTQYLLGEKEKMAFLLARGIDIRASLMNLTNDIDSVSIDRYTALKSLYTQYRRRIISDHMTNSLCP